jgi:DNA replication and repair protein RecF
LNRVFENDTLAIYNEQLEGMVNISSIKKFISQYLSLTTITTITGSQETVQVVYESHLFENNLLVLLQENINKDRVLHYTSVGTHKDDLSFEIDGHPIKIWFSGTTEIFSDCLKLAQFEFLKNKAA